VNSLLYYSVVSITCVRLFDFFKFGYRCGFEESKGTKLNQNTFTAKSGVSFSCFNDLENVCLKSERVEQRGKAALNVCD